MYGFEKVSYFSLSTKCNKSINVIISSNNETSSTWYINIASIKVFELIEITHFSILLFEVSTMCSHYRSILQLYKDKSFIIHYLIDIYNYFEFY